MKTLTIIFVFASQLVFAQWYVGGKTGLAFSNYKSKTAWKEVSNAGISVSFAAYKPMYNNFGVHIQLEYIQKGYLHKVCNTITDELSSNYLQIPIRMDYSFPVPSLTDFKIHTNVGFYTAWWLSGKFKSTGYDTPDESFDFKKNAASRFDFGPDVGGGIEYTLNNGSIILDLRYELGLVDLQKKVNDNTNNVNRSFIVGLSYMKIVGH